MSCCSSRWSSFSFFPTIRGPLHRPMCLLLLWYIYHNDTTQPTACHRPDRPQGLNVYNILAFVVVSSPMLSGCRLGKPSFGLPNFHLFCSPQSLRVLCFTEVANRWARQMMWDRYLPACNYLPFHLENISPLVLCLTHSTCSLACHPTIFY